MSYTRTTSDLDRAARRARTTTPPPALPEHPRRSKRLHRTYPRIPDVSPTKRQHLIRGSDRQLASLLEILGTPTASARVPLAAATNPTMRKVVESKTA